MHYDRPFPLDTPLDTPRDRLVLALDTHDLDAAAQTARLLAEYFRVAKVGLELYCAGGFKLINVLADCGYEVFCDLKLHDIPNTVGRAAKVIGKLRVSYLTVHAAGGLRMLHAAVEGLAAAHSSQIADESSNRTQLLAVTVLTSEPEVSQNQLIQRIELAVEAGCNGIVCAAPDLTIATRFAGSLICVVPGIRLPGDSIDDQRRVATPREAIDAGADLLVVGRSVTQAPDPAAAAERLHNHLRSSA